MSYWSGRFRTGPTAQGAAHTSLRLLCILRHGDFQHSVLLLSVHQLKTPGWNAAWWVTPCRATERKRCKHVMLLSVLKKLPPSQQFYSARGCASSNVSVRPLSLLILSLLFSQCVCCDSNRKYILIPSSCFRNKNIALPFLPTLPTSVAISSLLAQFIESFSWRTDRQAVGI
jgi:hypothetical protein